MSLEENCKILIENIEKLSDIDINSGGKRRAAKGSYNEYFILCMIKDILDNNNFYKIFKQPKMLKIHNIHPDIIICDAVRVDNQEEADFKVIENKENNFYKINNERCIFIVEIKDYFDFPMMRRFISECFSYKKKYNNIKFLAVDIHRSVENDRVSEYLTDFDLILNDNFYYCNLLQITRNSKYQNILLNYKDEIYNLSLMLNNKIKEIILG